MNSNSIELKSFGQCLDPVSVMLRQEVYEQRAFNSQKWADRFEVITGDNKEIECSSLPLNIADILESACPIFSTGSRL